MPPTEGGLFELREEETAPSRWRSTRSEEHTSELQSRLHLVCRLLLEKKKKNEIHWRIAAKRSRRKVMLAHMLVSEHAFPACHKDRVIYLRWLMAIGFLSIENYIVIDV